MADAQAYVNYGRWIADCPAGCLNAMAVEYGQASYLCGFLNKYGIIVGGCGVTAPLLWPDERDAITAALAPRSDDHRMWAPAGHRQTYDSYTPDGRTIAEAYPLGQTAADLLTENIMMGV